MLLAALGADLIKIESNRRLDPTRGRENRPYLRSLLFSDVNVGKRSMTLDMKNPNGRETAVRLISRADAVIDNFRPGVMQSWGLDYASLAESNERLVCASLSAVGSEGPLSQLPGYAGVFNALGGLGDLTGYKDGPPTELRTSVDMRVGAFFAVGVMQALLAARNCGRGSQIDCSAAECVAALCGEFLAEYLLTGTVAERSGNDHCAYIPHGVFACSDDGWLAVAIRHDSDWRSFLTVLPDRDAIQRERASQPGFRFDRADEAYALLAHWVGEMPRAVGFAALQRAGVPAAPVQNAADLAVDAQLLFREFFVPLNGGDSLIDQEVAAASPWLVNGRRPPVSRGPILGADTAEVLRNVLGMSDPEIDRLAASGALE